MFFVLRELLLRGSLCSHPLTGYAAAEKQKPRKQSLEIQGNEIRHFASVWFAVGVVVGTGRGGGGRVKKSCRQ